MAKKAKKKNCRSSANGAGAPNTATGETGTPPDAETEKNAGAPVPDSGTEKPSGIQEPQEATEAPTDALREAVEQLAAMTEKYVRLVAEYDNYRKRTVREMASMANVASEKLILQFLPILDNLDRATGHKNDKTTFEDYVKGIALIEDQLRRVLAQAGLRPMEVVGQPFDPAVHSAILQTESPDHGPGIVIAEAEKGYLLGEKIIRHPQVVVSK